MVFLVVIGNVFFGNIGGSNMSFFLCFWYNFGLMWSIFYFRLVIWGSMNKINLGYILFEVEIWEYGFRCIGIFGYCNVIRVIAMIKWDYFWDGVILKIFYIITV